MICIGIDPGTANTGYGVVELRGTRFLALDGGVITTEPAQPLEHRLAAIHERITSIIAEHRPAAMAIEDLYFGRNVGSALAVGHARGVAMLAAAQGGLECTSYTPQQIKTSVCGSGRADKEQVTAMVQRLLALETAPTPDHAADALAAAICHCSQVPALLGAR